jgi:GMP synthase (glutamine-hydrolysing)
VNFGRDSSLRPSLEGYAAVIVLGGPMNSDQIDTFPNLLVEVDILRDAVEKGLSVLGICLGAQLLARALGGTVSRNRIREIGWHDVELTTAGREDPVLSAFRGLQPVFQWHEDGIGLPPGATCLARSPVSEVQAFRYGDHAYGLQFHLEVDASLIERWLTVPENRQVLEEEGGQSTADGIRRATEARIDDLQALSRTTFSRWIDRFELPPRRLTLPSR